MVPPKPTAAVKPLLSSPLRPIRTSAPPTFLQRRRQRRDGRVRTGRTNQSHEGSNRHRGKSPGKWLRPWRAWRLVFVSVKPADSALVAETHRHAEEGAQERPPGSKQRRKSVHETQRPRAPGPAQPHTSQHDGIINGSRVRGARSQLNATKRSFLIWRQGGRPG